MTVPGEISWWAVAIAAIVYYVLGALWFTPFFGRAWDRSIGYDRSTGNGHFPISYYVVPLIGASLSTLIVTIFTATIGPDGVPGSAAIGAGIGLAIAAATFTNSLTPHTPRPYLFATITAGYHLTGCTIVGAIVGGF